MMISLIKQNKSRPEPVLENYFIPSILFFHLYFKLHFSLHYSKKLIYILYLTSIDSYTSTINKLEYILKEESIYNNIKCQVSRNKCKKNIKNFYGWNPTTLLRSIKMSNKWM